MHDRELDIQKCVAEGFTRNELSEHLAKKWKVSPHTIARQYDLIVQAMESIVEEGRAELRANLLTRNNFIYKQALQEGKLNIALDANKAISKLGGLDQKVEAEAKRPEIVVIKERGIGLVKDPASSE